MADAQRLPVKHLVLHHAVTPLWEDKSREWLANWFSNNGFARAYGNNPANWSGLINPYTGQRSYSQAQYAGQRVTAATPDATEAERAAGYRLVPLVRDPFGQICWHAGNWEINRASIGIENLGDYREYTLRDGDNKVIADFWRPHDRAMGGATRVWGHKEVTLTSTACPARIMEQRDRIIQLINGAGPAPAPAPTPAPGNKSNEQIANEVMAGLWGNGEDRKSRLRNAGYNYEAIQAIVNGKVGQSPSAPRKSDRTVASEVLAGAWGNNPERRQRLEAAGYNYASIQAIVNSMVGGGTPAPAKPARPSNEVIADQVIAGAWGNGPDRRRRLEAAGYSYDAVQAIVNRKVGVGPSAPARKSNEQIANEILAGQGGWGNNPQRREKLEAAGYDYNAVQSIINRKLGY